MASLNGKVAVVTGAAKGIGAATALRLAADGAAVVVNYSRSSAEAEAVVAKVVAAGGKAKAVKADVSKVADVKELFAAAVKEFGKVDILVNNAGVFAGAPIEQVDEKHIDFHFNLNVKGLLFATQEAVKHLGQGGVIVNISSGVAVTPPPMLSVYSATKGAVDVITRSLAVELAGRGIRVVGVAPGVTDTEGARDMDGMEEGKAYMISRTPLGRVGKPEEIAAAVAFLVSGDGAWITGETLQVGGGLKL